MVIANPHRGKGKLVPNVPFSSTEPSFIALNGLAHDADHFLTISDEEVINSLPRMAESGLETTASGSAGIAAALHPCACVSLGFGAESKVLYLLSEVPS